MTTPDTALCSAQSQQPGEQLFGSAKPHPIYFMLEYEGRWEPEVFDESDIPAPVKTRLVAQMAELGAHMQIIRQKPRLAPEGTIAFFVALAREHDPALYEFQLSSYDDLLALDLPALCAGNAAFDGFRRTEALFLVCTHGRHDRCCARHGVPVYEQLITQVGAALWQSSHVGGHRFAANLLAFPHGITYGRVTPESASTLADAYRAGQLRLEHYRGRAVYAKPVQAAEYFLRVETGINGVEAFRLADAERAPDGWTVRFAETANAKTHTLHLSEDREGVRVLANCGDTELTAYPQYSLLRYEVAASV